MSSSNGERYQGFAEQVRTAKEHLLNLLPVEQRGTIRLMDDPCKERVYPRTFEDNAAAVTGDPQYVFMVKTALAQLQAKVNAMWGVVYSDGTLEYVYRKWAAENRRLAREVNREDTEAELIFLMRKMILDYDPKGAPFRFYAVYVARKHLTAWAEQQNAAVRVGEKEMRKYHGRTHFLKESLSQPHRTPDSSRCGGFDSAEDSHGEDHYKNEIAVAAEQELHLIKKQEGLL